MKAFILILFLSFSFINLQEGEFQVKITNILSKDISYGGYLFLETDGDLVPAMSFNQENIFDLSIINDIDKSIYQLMCFFHKFEKFYGPARIACEVSYPKVKPGKYHLLPLEKVYSFLFGEIYIMNILPFNLNNSFNIIEGNELYFYSLKKIKLSFFNIYNYTSFSFDLYDYVVKDIIIYLEDIPVSCQASGHRMTCNISAYDLPQENRFQSLNVYIKDSNGNKKYNYLVYPIDILLYYVKKKTLKIKVTKLLSKSVVEGDKIVFDTSDKTLGNVLNSQKGFHLDIRSQDEPFNIIQIVCSFHKHPGENTKVFCDTSSGINEDGIYYIDEYISEGPIEDDMDKISANYQIIVLTFVSNGKLLYSSNSSNYSSKENIFDLEFREKIVLDFKNKEEVLNITLNHENFHELYKYYLGNSELKCYEYTEEYIICQIQGNSFEKSGVYYIEKLNYFEEKERLYSLPPVEVNFLKN